MLASWGDDLAMMRAAISEPGRYYHGERSIVLRNGMPLEKERRYLWHELVHAERGDAAFHTDAAVETIVEQEAVRRALPMQSLRWALGQELERHMVAEMLKLPEDWIQYRLDTATARERRELRLLQEGLWAEEIA
ncbi:hypothetical protein ABKW28_13020 [Nocardioides sp. 31GB23]|uniref:hypothetical protein n=1 Tax=Nocardioides sp. 31GB23 TaxID=3156065 RepID=UPI0032AF0153